LARIYLSFARDEFQLWKIEHPNISTTIDEDQWLCSLRLGVVYNAEDHQAKRAKFDFVVEDMNKNTADIFSRLQLGQYLPE
jgi:hypothetical protein